ncbi:hypothetical protein JQX13_03205 [Archangium violaceum]|uniref:hypothetical protein n=1 Tax=Archangium violaceum TaxID=83451 RepID=UPI00193C6C97|nr:hypothetical protein [Archangium violaceum]QRK09182.1 hypothetical protein JQX13_03205 [Archangium violaceum]
MKKFGIGGLGNFNPFRGLNNDTPRINRPTSPSTPPSSRPTPPRDGFDTAPTRSTTLSRGLFGPSHAEQFNNNPMQYSGQNVLNGYKLFPNGTPPQGVDLPTPNRPFVPANQSIATMNVHQQNGNANLSLSSPGGHGPQVHYLHYLSGGQAAGPNQGSFAGISGVPLHPGPGQPSMVTTGPLNGCAVHALHNPNNPNSLSFVHQADFEHHGAATGRQHLNNFMNQHNLQLVQSITPHDYSHPSGPHGLPTGATAFAHYDRPTQQWQLVGQLNEYKSGAGAGGRPELQRPQDLAGGGQWMRPIDLNNPLNINDLQ